MTDNSKLKNDPTLLLKMKSGYACLGYNQFLEGYCVLFADPVVASLNDLNMKDRSDFLADMSLIGDAITEVCSAVRINYGILGNSYPKLHAHIFPRFDDEPEHLKKRNVWAYPEDYWTDEKLQFNLEKHQTLKNDLINSLTKHMNSV